jgi:hypothetical protein
VTARLLAAAVLTLIACSSTNADEQSRVADLKTAVDSFDAELTTTEAQTRTLSSEWSEISEAYQTIAARYRDAGRQHRAARASTERSRGLYAQAETDFVHAADSWRFYQEVLKLAVAMDRARAGVTDGPGCERVSTASFRRRLKAQGIDLTGKDIDHIVPRALGGVDHPLNYQIMDSSLNRSLGKTWDMAKCEMAGRNRCVEAVAITSKCGTYRGGFFN